MYDGSALDDLSFDQLSKLFSLTFYWNSLVRYFSVWADGELLGLVLSSLILSKYPIFTVKELLTRYILNETNRSAIRFREIASQCCAAKPICFKIVSESDSQVITLVVISQCDAI